MLLGWSHSTLPYDALKTFAAHEKCDVCFEVHASDVEAKNGATLKHPHSTLGSREWYVHLPHPAPPSTRAMYECTTFRSHNHAYNLLYWQMLFSIYHKQLSRQPRRQLISLYQFCGSGGNLKFFERPSYKKYYHVDRWPLYLMQSSGELRTSIAGALFELWIKKLVDALKRLSVNANNPQNGRWGPEPTLMDLFKATRDKYWQQNNSLFHSRKEIESLGDCIMCQSFHASKMSLCSVCFKKYSAMPDAEKPDLKELEAKRKAEHERNDSQMVGHKLQSQIEGHPTVWGEDPDDFTRDSSAKPPGELPFDESVDG